MKKAGVLFSILIVLAGIAAIVSVGVASKNAARANDWVQTRATVERVEGTNVTYRYESGGGTHRVTSAGRPRVSYDTGKILLAYVNPENPAQAMLDLPPRPAMWPVVAGTVASLVGIGMAIAFARQPGDPSAAKKAKKGAPAKPTPRRPMERLQAPPPVKWNRGEDTASRSREWPPSGDDTQSRGPQSQ